MEPPIIGRSIAQGPYYYLDCNKVSKETILRLEEQLEKITECPVTIEPLYTVAKSIITDCGHLFSYGKYGNCPTCMKDVKFTWEDNSFKPITARIHAILIEFKNRLEGQTGFVEVTDLIQELEKFSFDTAGAYILKCGHVHSSNSPGKDFRMDRVKPAQCLRCPEKSTAMIPHFAFRDVNQFITSVKALAEQHKNKIVVLHPAQEMMRESQKGNLKDYSKTKLTKLFKELKALPPNSPVWPEFEDFFEELLKGQTKAEVLKECFLKVMTLPSPLRETLNNSLKDRLLKFMASDASDELFFSYLLIVEGMKFEGVEPKIYQKGCDLIKRDIRNVDNANVILILSKNISYITALLPHNAFPTEHHFKIGLVISDVTSTQLLSPELGDTLLNYVLDLAIADKPFALKILPRLKGLLGNVPELSVHRDKLVKWVFQCEEALYSSSEKVNSSLENYPLSLLLMLLRYSTEDEKFIEKVIYQAIEFYITNNIEKASNLISEINYLNKKEYSKSLDWPKLIYKYVNKIDKIKLLQTVFILKKIIISFEVEESLAQKKILLESALLYIKKVEKSSREMADLSDLLFPILHMINTTQYGLDYEEAYLNILKLFLRFFSNGPPLEIGSYSGFVALIRRTPTTEEGKKRYSAFIEFLDKESKYMKDPFLMVVSTFLDYLRSENDFV